MKECVITIESGLLSEETIFEHYLAYNLKKMQTESKIDYEMSEALAKIEKYKNRISQSYEEINKDIESLIYRYLDDLGFSDYELVERKNSIHTYFYDLAVYVSKNELSNLIEMHGFSEDHLAKQLAQHIQKQIQHYEDSFYESYNDEIKKAILECLKDYSNNNLEDIETFSIRNHDAIISYDN